MTETSKGDDAVRWVWMVERYKQPLFVDQQVIVDRLAEFATPNGLLKR